jgi:hypothetical protein
MVYLLKFVFIIQNQPEKFRLSLSFLFFTQTLFHFHRFSSTFHACWTNSKITLHWLANKISFNSHQLFQNTLISLQLMQLFLFSSKYKQSSHFQSMSSNTHIYIPRRSWKLLRVCCDFRWEIASKTTWMEYVLNFWSCDWFEVVGSCGVGVFCRFEAVGVVTFVAEDELLLVGGEVNFGFNGSLLCTLCLWMPKWWIIGVEGLSSLCHVT